MATRLAFRFWAVYLFLFIFPFPFDYEGGPPDGFGPLWDNLVPWFGTHFLNVRVTELGFTDNVYGFVRTVLFLALVAVLATCVWSIVDRHRTKDARIHEWFRLYVSVALGTRMLSYAIVKFYLGQFRPPGFARLMSPIGQYTPMELLWTFKGYSYPYTVFTGIVEATGGILLFVPRLATIGAVFCCAAMAHVFILNVSYQVNLKLFSANLLLMALFLLAPDLPWLAKGLILRRSVQPRRPPILFQRKWLNSALVALQITCGVAVAVHFCIQERSLKQTEAHNPLYGIWVVDDFAVNGQERPALVSDRRRWTHAMVDDFSASVTFMNFSIQNADGSQQHYLMHYDPSQNTIGLSTRTTILKCYDETDGDHWSAKGGIQPLALRCPIDASFTFEHPETTILRLSGQLDGQSIPATLRRVDLQFRLKRPFTWLAGPS